ncbi:MAG: hypothetical protein K1X61_12400 [Chitinophagales bacterium]|nr:hypothetical protein [Chitinophagales bacterium]
MTLIRRTILPILLAAAWITVSEFLRNTFLLHDYWMAHYRELGLNFPESTLNGVVWGGWSLCFAIVIYFVSGKFSLLHTTLLSWFAGFVLMWVVTGNLGVLPFGILPVAIPLSLLEAFVASVIIKKSSGPAK